MIKMNVLSSTVAATIGGAVAHTTTMVGLVMLSRDIVHASNVHTSDVLIPFIVGLMLTFSAIRLTKLSRKTIRHIGAMTLSSMVAAIVVYRVACPIAGATPDLNDPASFFSLSGICALCCQGLSTFTVHWNDFFSSAFLAFFGGMAGLGGSLVARLVDRNDAPRLDYIPFALAVALIIIMILATFVYPGEEYF